MASLFENSTFTVAIAFIIFIGVLVYYKVPALVTGYLDARADKIRDELAEARRLREEAQTLLASYERKQKEVAGLADEIVTHARAEAEVAAAQGKKDLEVSIARRLRAADDQIAAAEAGAAREVRDMAIAVAVAAAREVIATEMSAESRGALIDQSIRTVGEKLH